MDIRHKVYICKVGTIIHGREEKGYKSLIYIYNKNNKKKAKVKLYYLLMCACMHMYGVYISAFLICGPFGLYVLCTTIWGSHCYCQYI